MEDFSFAPKRLCVTIPGLPLCILEGDTFPMSFESNHYSPEPKDTRTDPADFHNQIKKSLLKQNLDKLKFKPGLSAFKPEMGYYN